MTMAPTKTEGSRIDTSFDELPASVGGQLGPTEWEDMTQERVNAFAGIINDHHFMHVDPERAKQTLFGGTIAHGFLALSVLAPLLQRLSVADASTSMHYGLNRVRFPAPLPVGARFRTSAQITEVTEIRGGAQAVMIAKVEVEGSERPAVVAEAVVRFYAGTPEGPS
jgi:acyl dehydratase